MLFVLVVAGLAGGFLAGLVGVGGGVIFGPVLFFAFQAAGIADPVLTPLTLGSSLLCTMAAASTGAVVQLRNGAVDGRAVLLVGCVAAVAVVLTGRLITTQPWYSKDAFQIVLGLVLLAVVARMLTARPRADDGEAPRRGLLVLGGTGLLAGTLSALAGIGGGIVMVPALDTLARFPLKLAAGTSTASIVPIAAVGVATYAILGLGADVPPGAIGYVDWLDSLALALPAMVAAPLGAQTAHRVNVRVVRIAFASLAAVVAVRLLWSALA
jgi:uncharacterized membrane protein YfcA